MSDEHEINRAQALGAYLKKERTGLKMSLRDVEAATENQVSNAYLSQLENGHIAKPSPHILHALAATYHIAYEKLMERAGYIAPAPVGVGRAARHGRVATHSIDNLTAEEEKELLTYLAYWRSKHARDKE